MATIYNSDLSKELIVGAKLQISRDSVPSQLAEKVVPVMEVNPFLLKKGIAKSNFTTAAASSTVYSTPTNQDFYITGYEVSFIKDAANDHATGSVTPLAAVIGGLTTSLCRFSVITLTAQNLNMTHTFREPIKIDRNSNITMPAVTIGAGVFVRSIVIFGFLDETSNA